MEISKEDARDLISGDLEGWKEIEREITDTSRWSIHYTGIFRSPDNRNFCMWWSEGATEQQWELPFEHDEPELVEVKPVPTTIIKWEPK